MPSNMHRARKLLPIITLIFFVVFSFASFQWCTDHDEGTKPLAEQDCCIQCCTSHNLVPLAAPSVFLNVPLIFTSLIESTDFFRPNLVSTQIYRPPIA
ncbi:MAG TPA: hypothetical protein DDW49_11855 [Deltaproteobacteria bacterium]|nr:hypothetical protein [Deltaproteobacteria bacterium]